MSSAERPALELGFAGPPLRLEWDVDALRELADRDQRDVSGAQATWRLEGEPDWQHASALRLISAAFDDGSLLGVAALRPPEAAGHDADAVEALLISPEGEVTHLQEALLSTEYGPDGTARRLGLELYQDAGGPPVRVAADRAGKVHEAEGGERSALTLRMDGTPGTGLHELVRAP